MLDHIGVGVSDLKASKAFFLQALSPLGVGVVMEVSDAAGPGLDQRPFLWLRTTEGRPLPIHMAFTAENQSQVDEFYRRALSAGGKDNGAPGIRPNYRANYYAAFVIGPDGHNVEAVCHRPGA